MYGPLEGHCTDQNYVILTHISNELAFQAVLFLHHFYFNFRFVNFFLFSNIFSFSLVTDAFVLALIFN